MQHNVTPGAASPEMHSIFSAQLRALGTEPLQTSYGEAGRATIPEVGGWHWACSPLPGCLISAIRLVARRTFVLPEQPQIDYYVISLLGSSDAQLMHDYWHERGVDVGGAFGQPLHPLLEQNVMAFPMRAGTYEFELTAGTVHDGVNLCLLPQFFAWLDAHEPGMGGRVRTAIEGRPELNHVPELREALVAINPARAALPGAGAFFQARSLDAVAALAAHLAHGHEDAARGVSSVAQAVDALLVTSLADPPSLDELAERLYMSRSRLCATYREEAGRTVGQRLTELRMEQAQALLGRGGTSIAEIARMVGFAHQSSFTTAFRRATGMTPDAWRRLAAQ